MKNKATKFVILGLIIAGFFGVAIQAFLSFLGLNMEINLLTGALFLIVLGLLFFVVIVEIVSALKIDDSTFHTVLISISLLALYMFSTDMRLFISLFDVQTSDIVFGIFSEIFFIISVFSCCWYIKYLYNLSIPKHKAVAIILSIFVSLTGYSITLSYGYGYIFHFLLVVIFAAMICTLLYKAEKKSKIGLTTYLSTVLFCLNIGVQNVNVLSYNHVISFVPGFSLVYSFISFTMFVIVYLMFAIKTDNRAVVKSYEADSFRTRALSGQIKPHFIFNSLEAIRALYHENIESGDKAIGLLSDFLRGSITSFDCDLIPFETEIDNIFNYTEFKNLKKQKKVEVFFNLDFTDFCVPPFSIQPFIENALKYSGVEEKENGCVIISSYKKGDCAFIEIFDNGKGFDISKISENSHGIKNACNRFYIVLGIIPKIESTLGLGTHITIKININAKKENKK